MRITAGDVYRFGPFQLDLPSEWSAEFEDGLHEILPPDGTFAIHISGYTKGEAIGQADLLEFAQQQSGTESTALTLASGLDGLTFDVDEGEQMLRYWLIRHGKALIAVTLTAGPEDFSTSAVPAQMLISSIRPNEET
ncbi:MAG: hypothetical protein AAGC81_16090 [Pseudomonadota bacterium]